MTLTPLPPEFFVRPTTLVAREMLGTILLTVDPEGHAVGGRIVETEAYTDAEDPGSHSYRGPTPRNRLMFAEPGHAYVYFIYGNHFCFNVVAHPIARAGAVLVRAIEPLAGLETMLTRRGTGKDSQLTNGPGKLCQALAIAKSLNGSSLFGPILYLGTDGHIPVEPVSSSTRIGLSQGIDLPWRYFLEGNRWVSGAKGISRSPKKDGGCS